MQSGEKPRRFCGREFSAQEVALIQEVVATCAGISRNELAHTICELLNWKRPTGRLKWPEAVQLLERLESRGILTLPAKRSSGTVRSRKRILVSEQAVVHNALTGSVEAFTPIEVELVQSAAQRRLFRELISRYHYLGYRYGLSFGHACAAKTDSRTDGVKGDECTGCFVVPGAAL